MKKDELIAANASLTKKAEEISARDQRIRKEFAKAFNWYEKRQYSYESTEPRLPSWEEVFAQVGKLLAARTFLDFDWSLSELKSRLENLENNIRSEIHPNLPQS